MLALPLVAPPEDNTWSGTYIPRSSSPDNTAPHAQNRQARQQRDEEKRMLQARSPLALLAQDEAAIAQRKAAIRNFGAYWIRPPGISKTLQAMVEEEVERREQEELERQERGLLDLQAQQQLEEQEAQTEQDLDEDVPEATFNEDSMLEGSHVVYEDLEEAELTGIARDEENLGIEHERDLDDSVPEAASFESESEDSIALPTGGLFGRAQTLQREGLPRSPGSMVLSSPQVESSFAASSPVRSRTRRAMRDD